MFDYVLKQRSDDKIKLRRSSLLFVLYLVSWLSSCVNNSNTGIDAEIVALHSATTAGSGILIMGPLGRIDAWVSVLMVLPSQEGSARFFCTMYLLHPQTAVSKHQLGHIRAAYFHDHEDASATGK